MPDKKAVNGPIGPGALEIERALTRLQATTAASGAAWQGRVATGVSRRLPLRMPAIILVALLLAGCETVPELEQPHFYSRDGISFRYPGNWSVTEDVTQPGHSTFRYLFLESPGSATVIVQYYEPRLDLSIQEFATRFHRNVLERTENLVQLGPVRPLSARSGMAVSTRSVVAGMPREGVEQFFSVSAAGVQVPHKFRAFRVETASATAFLVVQAATEDWKLVAPGLDLVLASFEVE